MKNRVIGSALIAALLSSVSGQPAQAQFNARDAFGITTDIFRLGVEINRANAEQERANAVVRQQQQQAAQAEANFYRRVQTALKTLGYYTMSIDGDPGPGTNRAIAAAKSPSRSQGASKRNVPCPSRSCLLRFFHSRTYSLLSPVIGV